MKIFWIFWLVLFLAVAVWDTFMAVQAVEQARWIYTAIFSLLAVGMVWPALQVIKAWKRDSDDLRRQVSKEKSR